MISMSVIINNVTAIIMPIKSPGRWGSLAVLSRLVASWLRIEEETETGIIIIVICKFEEIIKVESRSYLLKDENNIIEEKVPNREVVVHHLIHHHHYHHHHQQHDWNHIIFQHQIKELNFDNNSFEFNHYWKHYRIFFIVPAYFDIYLLLWLRSLLLL